MYLAERIEAGKLQLLEITEQALLTHEDSGVRIEKVSSAAGMSPGVIYSHFKSREGLLDAAYLHIYQKQNNAYQALLRDKLPSVLAGQSIMEKLYEFELDHNVATQLNQGRALRLRIHARAVARKSFRTQFQKIQEAHLAEVATILDLMSAAPIAESPNRDSRHLALFLEVLAAGRATSEVSATPIPLKAWFAFVDQAIRTMPMPGDVRVTRLVEAS
jgi:hypothetical protein